MRDILEFARSMIHSNNIYLCFWEEAVHIAIYLLNKTGPRFWSKSHRCTCSHFQDSVLMCTSLASFVRSWIEVVNIAFSWVIAKPIKHIGFGTMSLVISLKARTCFLMKSLYIGNNARSHDSWIVQLNRLVFYQQPLEGMVIGALKDNLP